MDEPADGYGLDDRSYEAVGEIMADVSAVA